MTLNTQIQKEKSKYSKEYPLYENIFVAARLNSLIVGFQIYIKAYYFLSVHYKNQKMIARTS